MIHLYFLKAFYAKGIFISSKLIFKVKPNTASSNYRQVPARSLSISVTILDPFMI